MKESSFELVVYIGGSVVSLWRGDEQVAFRALYTHEIPVSFSERNARLFLRLRELIYMYSRELKDAKNISIVMGSPWVTYHTRTLEYTREQPFVFSPSLEETLIQHEYVNIKKEIERTHGPYDDILIGLYIQKYLLQGYEVISPFGITTQRCTLPLMVAFAPRSQTHEILSLVEFGLQRDDIHIQSYWQWVAEIYQKQSVLVFLVGSVSTDIMCIYNGTVIQTASTPVGYEPYVHYKKHQMVSIPQHIERENIDQWSRECTHILYQWATHHVLPVEVVVHADTPDAFPYLENISAEIRMMPFFTTPPHVILRGNSRGVIRSLEDMI